MKEGTCKCGLECPLELESTFDFDIEKQSEIAPIPVTSLPNPAKYCSHIGAIANLAKIMSAAPGYASQFQHVHDPAVSKKGSKKRSRKKRPYSGVLTQQMIEAREAERRRVAGDISSSAPFILQNGSLLSSALTANGTESPESASFIFLPQCQLLFSPNLSPTGGCVFY